MSRSLPGQPDLEHLRNQAKALLQDAEAAHPSALARLRAVPKLSALPDSELAEIVQLADAQHAIALEHGAESWSRLKAAIEAGLPLEVQAEYFLRHVRDGENEAAIRWLERVPAIAGVNVFAASGAGNTEVVERLLASNAALATATHSDRAFTALLYAGASPLPANTPSLTEIVRALLKAGGDANSSYPGEGDGPLQSALYRACVRGHAGVARALLEAGARTDDGESIYHAAEQNQVACLEVLQEFKADFSGRQIAYDNTPLYFLAGYREGSESAARAQKGMVWLLEHGADPRVTSYKHNETPLHQVARVGAGLGIAGALLAHGADPNAGRADGRTPYAIAYRRGDEALCALLRAHGAKHDLTRVDKLLGAALRGDEAAARTLLAEEPGLLSHFDDEDRAILTQLPPASHAELLPKLVALGFDLGWEGPWAGTALHYAAWHGVVGLARTLVDLGAPRNVRDKTYGSSPLAWAVHGSNNCRSADDDYLAIVKLLLEAGSSRAASINRWGEPPENLGSRQVNAFVVRWYKEHPEEMGS